MKIVIAIILFCVIILFHELGHFLLAKANGVKVNEFCIGLGPTVIGKQIGETKYSIKLLPFGGACMMEGEDEASDNERAFNQKGVWQRFSIVFAGPFFNFIMAWFFSLIIICNIGVDLPIAANILDNSAASEAGLVAGDKIVKIGKKNVHFFRDISLYLYFYGTDEAELVYEREGVKYTTTITPKFNEEAGAYKLGIAGGGYSKHNFGQNLGYSFLEVNYWVQTTVKSLGKLVTGQVSMNEMSGPVGIVKTIGDTYEESKEDGAFYIWMNMLNMAILLSANLGVMNLLPLPALDGGRLFFFIIEAIRRKKIDPDKEGMVHFIGLVLLLLLMVFIMFNDIRKIVTGI